MVEIKDFRAKEFHSREEGEVDRILLEDRRQVPIMMAEIISERDFTITYQNEDDEWVSILIKGPSINTRVNNGEVQVGGFVSESEQKKSNEEW